MGLFKSGIFFLLIHYHFLYDYKIIAIYIKNNKYFHDCFRKIGSWRRGKKEMLQTLCMGLRKGQASGRWCSSHSVHSLEVSVTLSHCSGSSDCSLSVSATTCDSTVSTFIEASDDCTLCCPSSLSVGNLQSNHYFATTAIFHN